MPCFWATIRGRWSGLVNHSRPRRIVSRLLVDVSHSSGEEEQTLSSVCPRAVLHRSNRAVVMNAWRRYNNIVDSEMMAIDSTVSLQIFAPPKRHHAAINIQLTSHQRRNTANVILKTSTERISTEIGQVGVKNKG